MRNFVITVKREKQDDAETFIVCAGSVKSALTHVKTICLKAMVDDGYIDKDDIDQQSVYEMIGVVSVQEVKENTITQAKSDEFQEFELGVSEWCMSDELYEEYQK